MRTKCAACGLEAPIVRATGFCKVCWQHRRAAGEEAPVEKSARVCLRCQKHPVLSGRKYGHCERCFEELGGDAGFYAMFRARGPAPCACGCEKLVKRLFAYGHHTRGFTAEEQRRRALHNDGSTARGASVNSSTYVKLFGRHEHRFIAEQKLGRALTGKEVVHHKNENRKDNRPNNLKVLPSQGAHFSTHLRKHHADKK